MNPRTQGADRQDRMTPYLKKHLQDFVFDQLSADFLKKNPVAAPLQGAPIPLQKDDFRAFLSGDGVDSRRLAENMAQVMGCDTRFPHNDAYCAYIKEVFGPKASQIFQKAGDAFAEKGDRDNALISLRAARLLDPQSQPAIYSYALACNAYYQDCPDKELVGRLKAEALEMFELLVRLYPDFAPGYYYSGYYYLNLGLYTKAGLTWETFLEKSEDEEDRKEIQERLEQLKQPREIERGCNSVLAGRWQEGIQLLEPFTQGPYQDWWPLFYYLGMSYSRTGKQKRALTCFQKVLEINPSHIETMTELADLYAAQQDEEKEQKYRRKAALLAKGEQRGVEETKE